MSQLIFWQMILSTNMCWIFYNMLQFELFIFTGKGVDLILDCVGGSFFDQNINSIATEGTWVIYGLMGRCIQMSSVLGLMGMCIQMSSVLDLMGRCIQMSSVLGLMGRCMQC